MKKWAAAIPAIAFLAASWLPAKQIALTFEKLPYMEPLGFYTPREISNMVLRTLEANHVPAIGFVVEEKIEDRPESVVVLYDWVENGFPLGNSTYSYVDLNEVTASDFLTHIRDGNKYLRKIAKQPPGTPRYFRYPLLHEGNTAGKKNEVAKRLKRADFLNIPATVLVSDFEFNHLFQEASEDSGLTARMKALYLDHLARNLDYAENQSERVFGRPIPQILRLHLGIATATFLPDVLDLLRSKGYEFISAVTALEDEAFKTVETYVGPLGLSFIDRVAATQGNAFDDKAGLLSRREIADALNQPTAP